VLGPKTHQLQCEWIAGGGFLGKNTSQLVDLSDKHFAFGGFFIWRDRFVDRMSQGREEYRAL